MGRGEGAHDGLGRHALAVHFQHSHIDFPTAVPALAPQGGAVGVERHGVAGGLGEVGAVGVQLDLDAVGQVFAGLVNDDMAAGVMAAAYKRGLQIPDDLSLVGFDDTSIASVISPCLTTVRQPIAKMGEEATGILIRRIQDPERAVEGVKLDFEIIERDSVSSRSSRKKQN